MIKDKSSNNLSMSSKENNTSVKEHLSPIHRHKRINITLKITKIKKHKSNFDFE